MYRVLSSRMLVTLLISAVLALVIASGSLARAPFIGGQVLQGFVQLPVKGVPIELLDEFGNILATKYTDAFGDFEFPGVEAGAYFIRAGTKDSLTNAAALAGDWALAVDEKLILIVLPENETSTGNIFLLQSETKRVCYLPVTFSTAGWAFYCDEMIHARFHLAFKQFMFFGTTYYGRVSVGAPTNVLAFGQHSITFFGSTFSGDQLCRFLTQIGPCDKLYLNYYDPSYLLTKYGVPTQNDLAVETLALMLNIGYNDMRLMPRTPGYDLENFRIVKGIFKGRYVGDVLNCANALLAGVPSCQFVGLPKNPADACEAVVDVLRNINENYEFVDYDTFIDRGYLIPNKPLGPPAPPHIPMAPFVPSP